MATRQIEPRREAIGTGRIEKDRERERKRERERERERDGKNGKVFSSHIFPGNVFFFSFLFFFIFFFLRILFFFFFLLRIKYADFKRGGDGIKGGI